MPSHSDYRHVPIVDLRINVRERGITTSIEPDGKWDLAVRESSRSARCARQRVRLVIVPGRRAVQHAFDLCGLARQLPFIAQPGRGSRPLDPVSLRTGDAGAGGALSSRPRRRRSPDPTWRTAPRQPRMTRLTVGVCWGQRS